MQGRTHIIKMACFSFLLCLILGSNALWAQEGARKHVVEALDNYYSISLKYDVSIEELKQANPGIAIPKKGDVLVIPQKGQFIEASVSTDCARLRKNRHEIYRVALMIPFYLEQVADTLWADNLDPTKINDLIPFRFTRFYHGFMLAADSLRKEGLNLEIYVYDVDHLTSKALNVIHKPELKKMDLIFGPFFKSSFSIVADFAKENKIPVINPLSARSDILQGNPFVYKLLPTIESQPALLAGLISRDFNDHRIIFYVANPYHDNELIANYIQAIEQNDKTGKQKVILVDYSADSIQGFHDHASLIQPNLVIIYSENEVLPAALLSKLSALKNDYQISVIGLPEWEKFGNIESGYLLTLNAHVFQSSFTDYNSDNVKGFIQSYRSKYMDEPVDYALTGFDAGFFFLSALLNYGNDFERCIDEQRIQLIQNQYHFKRIEDGGYDNVYWNILQYEDYRLVNRSVSWK